MAYLTYISGSGVYVVVSSESSYGQPMKTYLDGVQINKETDIWYTNSAGVSTLAVPYSGYLDDGNCHDIYCIINGVNTGNYKFKNDSLSSGTCSGGGSGETGWYYWPSYEVDTDETIVEAYEYDSSTGNVYIHIYWAICNGNSDCLTSANLYAARIYYSVNGYSCRGCDDDDDCLVKSISKSNCPYGSECNNPLMNETSYRSNISYYVGIPCPDTLEVEIRGSIQDRSPEPECDNFSFTRTLNLDFKKFYWKSETDRPAAGKEVSKYITADKWNELCEDIGLSSLANKSKGDKIKATEVNKIISALGGGLPLYRETLLKLLILLKSKTFTILNPLVKGGAWIGR